MNRDKHYSEDPELRELARRAETEYEGYDGELDNEVDESYDEEYDDEYEYTDGEYDDEYEDYEDDEAAYDDETIEDDEDLDEDDYEDVEDEEEEQTETPLVAPRETTAPEDWSRFAQGLSRDNKIFIAFVFVTLIFSAYWHTLYNSTIREVSTQEKELKDLRYRRLYMSAELVRLERITSIEASIESLKLDLEHPTKPPYEVIDTTSTNKHD